MMTDSEIIKVVKAHLTGKSIQYSNDGEEWKDTS